MSESVRVNGIFGSHMVLQRRTRVPVWGTGVDGTAVKVSCGGGHAEAVVEDGAWKVELPPSEAGGPYELVVEADGRSIVCRDVWFGDVWLAGGQSNMEWGLAQTADAAAELAQADMPNLRCFDVPKVAYEDGIERRPVWQVSSPAHAGAFSAVAYHFAKRVIANLGVPIGIIGCNWGGTSASCWVPERVLSEDSELRIYVDEYEEQLRRFDPEVYQREGSRFNQAVADYNRRFDAGLRGKALGDYPWPVPFHPHYWLRPYGVYGTMLLKAAPYALKGFLYYQGEADANRPLIYDKLMTALIEHWRTLWGNPELPFLFVQLPAYGYGGNELGDEWPLLRESQVMVTEQAANTGLVVALDCGDRADIHPIDKKPVGERLALLALERVYGLPFESSGPVYKELQVEGESIILSFDHIADGLVIKGTQLIGFEVADETHRYYPAQAFIQGETVVVRSGEVKSPVAVRYAWANYPEANLFNSLGLPAGPFRTDRRDRAVTRVSKSGDAPAR